MKNMQTKRQVTSGFNHWAAVRLGLPLTGGVLAVLAGLVVVTDVPRMLAILLGSIFLLWSLIFWGLQGNAPPPPTFAGALIKVAVPVLAWVMTSSLVLGSVFWLDRAGWLWTQATGYDVALEEDYTSLIDLSVEDFVANHPTFTLDPENPGKLLLPEGEYKFDTTVIIPRGTTLTIAPGAVLRFGAGRSLVSYSPLVARGSIDRPIVFTAQNKWFKWGAVGVIQVDQVIFEAVRFEHGRNARVNGVDLFGALTLVETDGEITQSQFLDLFGKDAVNVRFGKVVIKDNLFQDAYKDCLDYDSARGEISDNLFINCGDDGIDLGGDFDVEVFGNTVLDPRGGRISAEHDLEIIISQNTVGYLKKGQ